MILKTRRGEPFTPLSTFSKAVSGGIALNFSPSGGSWCSLTCGLHPTNGGICYAARLEALRGSLAKSLARKQVAHGDHLKWLARVWNPADSVPWIRLSAFGTVPHDPNPNREDWILLASKLAKFSGRVHFPVETVLKFQRYASLGFAPRLSLQSASIPSILGHTRLGRPVAVTVRGEKMGRESAKTANVRESQILARNLRRLGRSAVVCPAIAGNAKCGKCRACADTRVSTVIYPEH